MSETPIHSELSIERFREQLEALDVCAWWLPVVDEESA